MVILLSFGIFLTRIEKVEKNLGGLPGDILQHEMGEDMQGVNKGRLIVLMPEMWPRKLS